MFELETPFELYNKQYQRNFLFKYTNLNGDFIDDSGVVHNKKVLTKARNDLKPKIIKAGLK